MANQFWLGIDKFPVLDAGDGDDLESAAAVHEFRNKMPRHLAEERAHSDYIKERAIDAAAHHLLGIKAAHAAGHTAAASSHGEAYVAAMKAAGLDAFGPPHQKVMDRIKTARPGVYSFKKHPADIFFSASPEKADSGDAHIKEILSRLERLRGSL
jgi:hypothetical protein